MQIIYVGSSMPLWYIVQCLLMPLEGTSDYQNFNNARIYFVL